jgi:hypothetical protein
MQPHFALPDMQMDLLPELKNPPLPAPASPPQLPTP